MAEPRTGHDSLARADARRERLREVMDRFEVALSAPPGRDVDAWRDDVRRAVAELAAILADHTMATEADDGLFAEIRERAPQLDPRVQALEADHRGIADQLTALRAVLDDAEPDEAVERVRDEGTDLLGALIRHRQTGADLLYEAYWVDVPSAD